MRMRVRVRVRVRVRMRARKGRQGTRPPRLHHPHLPAHTRLPMPFALGPIPPTVQIKLAGNGMHLHAIGSFFMWCFAHLVERRVLEPLTVMGESGQENDEE